MKTPKIIRMAQLGILLLSLGSYSLSFDRLYLAALSAGTVKPLAVVYGLLLEGFVSLATFTAWVCRELRVGRRDRRPMSLYPWAVALAAFSFSLVANWDSSLIPAGMVRALPVVMLPLGVHLLIVLTSAHSKRAALEAQVATTEPEADEEATLEIPALTHETVNVDAIENAKAVAYKILMETAVRPQDIGYFRKRYNKELATDTATEVAV